MKLRPLACALLLAACDGDETVRRETGMALAGACSSVMFEGTPLTHCIADPRWHRIAMVLGPQSGAPYRSLSALADARAADSSVIAFATNGGMFDTEGKPIGYYVERGERRHTLNRAQGGGNFHLLPNGVFYGTGNIWKVRTADDFAATVAQRPDFATQSGPMLVIAGKLHPKISRDGDSHYIRNGVGVDRRGRAHFVISDAPLSFGKLARFFRDELRTPNALYLDGNVSALWDPMMGRIDGGPPLGPLIVVEKRAMAAGSNRKPRQP